MAGTLVGYPLFHHDPAYGLFDRYHFHGLVHVGRHPGHQAFVPRPGRAQSQSGRQRCGPEGSEVVKAGNNVKTGRGRMDFRQPGPAGFFRNTTGIRE